MNKEKVLKIIGLEWQKHKNEYSQEEIYFECCETENNSMGYGVGCSITEPNGKTFVLDTKEKAEAYTISEREKRNCCCPVCDRFRIIIKKIDGLK